MPTYTFQEKIDRRSAEVDRTSRKYTRVYQLLVDERVSEAAARAWVQDADGGNLLIGTVHPDDSTTKISNIKLEDEAIDGKQWLVTIEYAIPTIGIVTYPTDPLDRVPEIQWSTKIVNEDFFVDWSTTPKRVVNSAGFALEPLPQRERGYISVSYTRNYSVEDFQTNLFPFMQYDMVVNSVAFDIDGITIPVLRARLQIASASKLTEGLVTYYRVQVVIDFRQGDPDHEADGWREWYLDVGTKQKIGSGLGGAPDEFGGIKNEDGEYITEPWPLDSDGTAKATNTSFGYVGPFQLYKEYDFAPFDFS